MKKLLIFLFVLGLSLPTSGQEKYFNYLKGIEDTSGVTHLFYKVLNSKNSTCTDMDGYSRAVNNVTNHLYHFDTSSLEDSIKFRSGNRIQPGCDEEWRGLEKLTFTANHPDSNFIIRSTMGGLYGGYYFHIDNHDFELNLGNPLGVNYDEQLREFVLTTPNIFLVIKAKNKDEELLGKSFKYTSRDSSWHTYNYISDLPDSLFIDFSVTGISPYTKGRYVGIKDSAIVQSNDYGDSFEILTNHTLDDWEYADIKFGETYFDADSNSFYITINNGSGYSASEGWDVYLIKQEIDHWSFNEVSKDYQPFNFTLDGQVAGSYFFSKKDSLLHSNDYGESSSLITSFTSSITGLYKKPDSDILYVLTKEELLKVNTQTQQTTTLKELPVSNEKESSEIPTQISLEQNYPNPFNPSTVISYQLNSNQLVNLEVFDVTGRKVAVLVDGELKTTGRHQVTFDAAELSSGMYFYRLETGGKILTQKMMLVK